MRKTTSSNVNQLRAGELLPVLAVIAVSVVFTVVVSGVPGGPGQTDSEPGLGRIIGDWTRVFLRKGQDGRFRRDLERPGSETWKQYAGPDARASVQAATGAYLGTVGTRHAVETLVTLCARPDTDVARAAQGSLVKVINRNRGRWIYARIGTIARSTPLGVAGRRRLVHCLSEVGDPDSISLLSGLSGRDAGLRALIMGVVARLAEGDPEALKGTRGLPADMGILLTDKDPLIRREGALAVGRAGDLPHIKTLIAMLKDQHRGARGNAHWALTHSLGINLPPDHRTWATWYAAESEWWTLNKGRICEQLAGADEALRAAAVRDVSAHPLARDEVHLELEDLAFRGHIGVRRMACFALGRLRCRSSTRILVGILEDPDETVREAAWHALKQLTGLDVPPRSAAWTEALAARR